MKELAEALKDTLVSPNVLDVNMEPANIVDAIVGLGDSIKLAIDGLGNNGAATSMGAIEAHGKAIIDGADNISSAIRELAEAINNISS